MSTSCSSLVVSAGIAFSLAAASVAAAEAPKGAAEVLVEDVQVQLSDRGPVVLLRVGSKAVPVFVDALVAQGIQGALMQQKPPRPLSHDLMTTIIQALDARVSQVVITEKDATFYGALTIVAGNTSKVFDSRSSDAIALAIRFKAPILLDPRLVDAFGIELPKPLGKEL
jgi:bifunctional DNase/RNase